VIKVECQVSAFSRAGGRERNEDACGYTEQSGIVCCVLADGAGGHGGGDTASRICVQSVLDQFAARPEVSTDILGVMLGHANDAVLRQQQTSEALANMRSTLVVLLFDPGRRIAAWGHVGDSRLYLFRNGSLFLRTCDHSLVQTMVDSGVILPEQVSQHPEANVLFTSLGLRDAFQPDVIDAPCALSDGDALLLCSDGVWGATPDIAMEDCLRRARTLDEWLQFIDQKVRAQVHGGSDNYSAVGVWCGDVIDNLRTLPKLRRNDVP
jgi:PPM family protein phosphatase